MNLKGACEEIRRLLFLAMRRGGNSYVLLIVIIDFL